MSDYDLRPATADDAAAVCRIYNQGIEDRVATLETELRTPGERREWLANRSYHEQGLLDGRWVDTGGMGKLLC